jgi:hypothetical protein
MTSPCHHSGNLPSIDISTDASHVPAPGFLVRKVLRAVQNSLRTRNVTDANRRRLHTLVAPQEQLRVRAAGAAMAQDLDQHYPRFTRSTNTARSSETGAMRFRSGRLREMPFMTIPRAK